MDNVIYAAVYFAVTLGAFLIGKYVCPNIPKTVTDKLGELSEWAAKFVEWAKEFKKDKTGEEKMAAVDGIYDSDPKVNPDAKKYEKVSIQEVIDKKLAAVDLTASIMCMEQKMPMLVFGLEEKDSIINTVHGKFNGTEVTVE